MADQLPQPGGGQRSQTKFIVFENFEKMNTQSLRQSLSEKELAWLENLQPIAPNNLTCVPAAAAALTNIAQTSLLMFYADIGGTDYIIVFTTAGSAYAVNLGNGASTKFAADATFSSAPDVTTWQASRILINDSTAGYCTYDGTLFVKQGMVSPNLVLVSGGFAYTAPPAVTISGGSGTGATATAQISGGSVIGLTLTNPGTGYLATDVLVVSFGSGAGSGATGHTTLTAAALSGLALAAGGSGFVPNSTFGLTFTGGGGTGAAGIARSGPGTFTNASIVSVTLTNAGSGYTSAPTVAITSPGSGTGAQINAVFSTTVASIVLDTGGSGYATAPTVIVSGGGGSNATAHSTQSGGIVNALILDTAGNGFSSAPTVTISSGQGAAAFAHVWPFVPKGTTLAVFQGRVWLGGGQLLQWTGTGASYNNVGYDDFLSQDASGSLLLTDADLVHAITALRSLNNYLFIMGDQSVKQIGNISLNAAGAVTLFTILTLSSDQGTIYPKSCISYNRVFMFINPNGIFGVFGSSVQKLSSDMDGIFKLIDFSQVPQGAVVDINAIHNAIFLVRYKDPAVGTRSLLLLFDGKKWFVASQGNSLAAIVSAASAATGLNALWGSSIADITNLFANQNGTVSFKFQSALTHHGNAVQGKKVIRAGLSSQLNVGTGSVTVTLDTETSNGPNRSLNIPQGFAVVGGSNDAGNNPLNAAGIYLGITITGTLNGYTITNAIEEYQETSLWKGA